MTAQKIKSILKLYLVQCLCRGLCTTEMFTSATIIRCWAFWAQGFGEKEL